MSDRRTVTALMTGILTLISVCFVLMNTDTNWRRTRVNKELMEFRDRLRTNPSDKEALAGLIGALDDPYHFSRSAAAGFLGQVGSNASGAVPALARAVNSKDTYLAGQAAFALASMGPAAKAAVPSLIEALRNGNCTTGWNSAEALGNIETDAEISVPALVSCLDVHNLDRVYADPGPQLAFEATGCACKVWP